MEAVNDESTGGNDSLGGWYLDYGRRSIFKRMEMSKVSVVISRAVAISSRRARGTRLGMARAVRKVEAVSYQ